MSGLLAKTHCPNLYERLLASEPAAYEEFAEFFGKRFAVYYRTHGLTRADAEDLTISTITDIALKVMRSRSRPVKNFDSWVFTLARHALSAWLKAHRVPLVPIEQLILDITAEPPQRLHQPASLVQVVSDALAKLPPDEQILIKLRHFEEEPETFETISSRLGITISSARLRYYRALRLLQLYIEGDPRSSSFLKDWDAHRWRSQSSRYARLDLRTGA